MLSVKLHEMLLKEDLSSHNQRSVMQALALVRSDTTACVGIVTGCVGALTSGTTMLAYIAVSIQAVGWVGLLGGRRSTGLYCRTISVLSVPHPGVRGKNAGTDHSLQRPG